MVWQVHSIVFRDTETGIGYCYPLSDVCTATEAFHRNGWHGIKPPADCPEVGAQEPHDRPDAGDGASAEAAADGPLSDPAGVPGPPGGERDAAPAAVPPPRDSHRR